MFDYLLFGAGGFAVFILLVYIYTKDSETSKKFFLYEKSIEDLNKKIYDLEKILNKNKNSFDKEEIQEYVDELVEENFEKITGFIVASKKEQEEKFNEIKDEVIEKLGNLEEKIKNFTSLSESYVSNEKKIISLYNKGLSVSEIARNLRVGIGEVELVLKIEGIK